MKDLNGKNAVVTGAGSGIGRALAIQLAKEGCNLGLNDFNQDSLAETVALIRKDSECEIYSEVFDVSQYEKMEDFARNTREALGTMDIVINNAGVALGAYTVEDVPLKEFEWLMGINFWGMVYGSKAFLPQLKESAESCLVNISSVLGLGAIGRQAPYCSSKFAIRGFTESLRMEAALLFPHVTVISVHPGGIQTNIVKNARWLESPLSEEERKKVDSEFERSFINTPAYAANTIINGIKKKKQRVLIGKDAKRMWRVINWFPVRYTKYFINSIVKEYSALDNID